MNSIGSQWQCVGSPVRCGMAMKGACGWLAFLAASPPATTAGPWEGGLGGDERRHVLFLLSGRGLLPGP
eukprot:13498487-Alexandrium_andersonii.AAC.1